MRRLKLQVQTSVDGYMAGPNGEMDWMTYPWTDDIGAYVEGIMEGVDTILLGRRLAEGFIPAWASGPEGEPQESIDWMNNTPRVVVSDSLSESPWENATVIGTDLGATVGALKERDGGDIITYGGGTLVRGLIERGLIDDLHLFVNPAALGGGMPVFPQGAAHHRLRRVAAQPFHCGITVLHVAPERG